MQLIEFEHGGEEYDRRYPDGIPTSIVFQLADGRELDSGLVMYPSGHARNETADLKNILATKFSRMGELGMDDHATSVDTLNNLNALDAEQLKKIWDFEIKDVGGFS
jgi:2-methylcitrate dehydratase